MEWSPRSPRATAIACLALAALPIPRAAAQELEVLAFEHVFVVEPDAGRVQPDRTVVVRGDRIVSVGPADRADVPAGARRIDGGGKYLMPGLADMHVHLSDPRDGLLYVANGVTTIRNLSGQPLHLDLDEAYRRGDWVGPRLVSSGPQVRLELDAGPDVAEAIVREHAARGYASIKAYAGVSVENLRVMKAVADEVGIPIDGHVTRGLALEDVLAVGAHREISHAEETLYSYFYRHEEPDEELIPGCVELLADAGVWVTATLAVYRDIALQVEDLDSVLARPEMRFLPPLSHLVFGPLNKYVAFDADDVRRIEAGTVTLFGLIGALHEAGVPMLLGTDAMNPSVVPGFSIHDELAALVEAGLSPHAALAAGTTAPAAFQGLEEEVGLVTPGMRADLVLLEANPLEDIAHTRLVAGVLVHGRWFDAGALERLLEEQVAGYAAEQLAMAAADRASPDAMLARITENEETAGTPPVAFYVSFASVYRLIGNSAAVMRVLEFARERHPGSPILANQLAEALAEQGDGEAARTLYGRTLELDPDNSVAQRALERP